MKRLILLLLCATPLAAQTPNQPMVGVPWKAAGGGTFTPALISSYSGGTDNAYEVLAGVALTGPSLQLRPSLPFVGGANNCGIVVFSDNTGYTISSVTDDKSEIRVAGPSVTDVNHSGFALYYVLGTTAGTGLITVAFSGTAPAATPFTYMGGIVKEAKNCGTTIGGAGTLDTAATGSALTLTLSAAPSLGDMVLGYFWDTNGGPTTQNPLPYTTSTAGAGFTLDSDSTAYGKLSEYSTTTTSTSVQATFSGTDKILGAGIVMKKGLAGNSAPATKYIDHIVVEETTTTTPTIKFPCSGNTIVILYTSNVHSANFSSVSGASATWNTGPLSNTNALVEIPYGLSATCSPSTTISPTLAATPNSNGGTEFVVLSVSNAASSFDKSAGPTTGTQNTAANLTTGSITPAANNEIIFGLTGVTWHTPMGTAADANGHTPAFRASVDTKADNADPTTCNTATPASTLDGDNALAFFQNTSDHTAITFIWTGTQTTGPCTTNPSGMGGWDFVALALN